VRLRWNHDGEGKRRIPPRLLAFARAKRSEFYRAMCASAAGAFVIGRVAAMACGSRDALEPGPVLRALGALAGALLLGFTISAIS